MSKPDVWMPFFHKDFFNATTHLTLEQQMAYLRLICGAWDRAGKLPLDMEQLRLISTMEKREWKKSGQILMDFFTKNDLFFSHKRVDKELEKANANIVQKSAAGKASAEKKAAEKLRLSEENAKNSVNGRSTPVETALPTEAATEGQRQSNPSPSPSPTVLRKSSLRSQGEAVGFEEFWQTYPRKVGKGAARKAFTAAMLKTTASVVLQALASQQFGSRERFIPHPSTWLNEERWLDEVSQGDPVLRAAGLFDADKPEQIPEFLRLKR